MIRSFHAGIVFAIGCLAFMRAPLAAEPIQSHPPSRIVDERVMDWVRYCTAQRQPTAADRQLDRIGWAGDIREAVHLARQHQRPIFLFTHSGRIKVGHC